MQPSNPNQQRQYSPPTSMSGPFATQPTGFMGSEASELEAVRQPYSKWSIAFLILLVLTFFTPLGSALFLPLLIIGGGVAFRSIDTRTTRTVGGVPAKLNPVFAALRILFIICMVVAGLIVALIAFVFIGVSTGLIKLDFGS